MEPGTIRFIQYVGQIRFSSIYRFRWSVSEICLRFDWHRHNADAAGFLARQLRAVATELVKCEIFSIYRIIGPGLIVEHSPISLCEVKQSPIANLIPSITPPGKSKEKGKKLPSKSSQHSTGKVSKHCVALLY